MERAWNFAKRHRGKLFVAGVVSAVSAGGLYLVHKLAEAKYREWKEKESKEMMEKVRQQHHFESTWRTGNVTLKSAIWPALVEALSEAIDTESVVAEIKKCKNLPEKVQLWQQLKEMAFGRCLCLILCSSFLDVVLRCQLSILAGYSYRETVDKKVLNDQNENRQNFTQKLTSQVQEKYLSLCQLFIVKVVPTLCRDVIESVVKNVTKDVDLSQTMSAGDVEKYLTEMADLADRVCIEETRKLLQSNVVFADDAADEGLDEAERSTLDILLVDTIDVLECRQLAGTALASATSVAANAVLDKVVERFPTSKAASDDNFSPQENSKAPLAKLIPILCSLLSNLHSSSRDSKGVEDFFRNFSGEQTKTFASNIYQSFSIPVASFQ